VLKTQYAGHQRQATASPAKRNMWIDPLLHHKLTERVFRERWNIQGNYE